MTQKDFLPQPNTQTSRLDQCARNEYCQPVVEPEGLAQAKRRSAIISSDNGFDKSSELTTTIHSSSLRSVPASQSREEAMNLLSEENQKIISDLQKDSAMFIVLSGPGLGSRFLLNTEVTTIGRNVSCEIFFDDVTVSRKHANVVRDKSGSFTVIDQGSLNGTYINSVSKSEFPLRFGDEVQIGKYRLVFFQSNKESSN